MKMAFVNGCPENVSVTLRQLPGINEMNISELIPKMVTARKTQELETAVIARQIQVRWRKDPTEFGVGGETTQII